MVIGPIETNLLAMAFFRTVASDRSVRSDASSPVGSFLFLVVRPGALNVASLLLIAMASTLIGMASNRRIWSKIRTCHLAARGTPKLKRSRRIKSAAERSRSVLLRS